MTEVSWGKDEEIKTMRGGGHLGHDCFLKNNFLNFSVFVYH
jgi:hypothetical protein